jgi:hypothetical protein
MMRAVGTFMKPRSVRFSTGRWVLSVCVRTVYRYFTVPSTIVEALLTTPSKGAYFTHHIRNVFPYRKVDPAAAS